MLSCGRLNVVAVPACSEVACSVEASLLCLSIVALTFKVVLVVSRLGCVLLLIINVVVLLIGMCLVLNSLGFVLILAEVCGVLLTC